MASVVHMHAGAMLSCGRMPLGSTSYNIAGHSQICTSWTCNLRLSTNMLIPHKQDAQQTRCFLLISLQKQAKGTQQLMQHLNGRLMICRASHWRCSSHLGKKRKKRPTTAESGSQVGSDAC